MATLRELKGRIGSVASSEKITGAMKMISSAKMHKAEQALRQLQPFRTQVETIIANLLSADAAVSSPLTETRDVKSLALVVWGSDDGLCGAFNVNIFKQLLQRLEYYRDTFGPDLDVTVIPIGSKIAKAVRKIESAKLHVVEYPDVNSKTADDAVKAFTWTLRDRFVDGTFDRVDILYMAFKSVSRQRPEAQQLLPLTADAFADVTGGKATGRPYIFEPDAASIFATVIPMYVLAVTQDVFTENRASEQAARVMAMQSANDNAKKLLESLRLEYNKLRQQSITTELLDILGGQVK